MTEPAASPAAPKALGVRTEIALVVGTLLVTTLALVGVLWWPGVSLDTDAARARLDAIRTALSFGIGAGGAVALWLAIRRQRSTERDIISREQTYQLQVQVAETNRLHQERVADATERHQERLASNSENDAAQRRVNEMYNNAVEQLGSDKAPVRLGSLYSLERLASSEEAFRKIVVEVVCAYLRMPLDASVEAVHGYVKAISRRSSSGLDADLSIAVREEIEVRRAAQEILHRHLIDEENPYFDHLVNKYWEVDEIRLSGAVLIDFDLSWCVLPEINFDGATFVGPCDFQHSVFRGNTSFDDCTFLTFASFEYARFSNATWFQRIKFDGTAYFDEVKFRGQSDWGSVEFRWGALFKGAVNESSFSLRHAKFENDAEIGQLRNVDLEYASASPNDDYERSWPSGWEPELSGDGGRMRFRRIEEGSKSGG